MRRRILGIPNQLLGASHFLLRDERRGVDFDGFLEFDQRIVELAGIAKNLSAVHVRGSGEKLCPLVGRAELQVFGLERIGLLVKVVGLFVVLTRLRISALVIQRFGLVGKGG